MYDTDTRNQFIELRGKGNSLQSISRRLKVSKRTLVEWLRQDRETIRVLRVAELEALIKRNLLSIEWNLSQLDLHLQRIETELHTRELNYVDTPDLFRLAALVREEIRKVCRQNEPVLDAAEAQPAENRQPL